VMTAATHQRDNPAQMVEFALSAVEKLQHLISGVVVHVPSGINESAAQLVSALARFQVS